MLLLTACTSSSNSGNNGAPMGGMTTNRYDNARTGWDRNETILNTTNVASGKFGYLFSRPTEGWVHAQPLYYPDLTIKNAKHNVVYVVTERNMVFAFDADDPAANEPLWSKTLAPTFPLSGVTGMYPGCMDILGEAGISSTPVISAETQKLYLVSKTPGMGQQLHALDLATGDEAPGSPVTIGAMNFDGNLALARAGLAISGGAVYITFASQCDSGDYHGWVMAYDAKSLKQLAALNTTPNPTADTTDPMTMMPTKTKAQGGIWQSGAGPSFDANGMLVVVGNGDSSGNNLGMSVVRLKPADQGLSVVARFTPDDAVMLNAHDKDLSTAAVVLGDSGLVVAGNKVGDIYLLKQSDLSLVQKTTVTSIPPPVPPKTNSNEIHSFAYWTGPTGPMIYIWPDKSSLQAFKLEGGKLADAGTNTIISMAMAGGHPGGLFVVSSDGSKAGSGILWAIVPIAGDAWHDSATAQLFAFDATDVTKPPLWSSPDKPDATNGADFVGVLAKWAPPVVANGKVYLVTGGTSAKLMVYGLKP